MLKTRVELSTLGWMGLSRGIHLGEAVNFFRRTINSGFVFLDFTKSMTRLRSVLVNVSMNRSV